MCRGRKISGNIYHIFTCSGTVRCICLWTRYKFGLNAPVPCPYTVMNLYTHNYLTLTIVPSVPHIFKDIRITNKMVETGFRVMLIFCWCICLWTNEISVNNSNYS